MRGLGGIAPLYLGTLLAGAAIALTQVVTPAWVRAKAPQRRGRADRRVRCALVAGATIATFIAIPFEDAFGGWEAALAIWALAGAGRRRRLAAAGARAPTTRCRRRSAQPLWRNPMAWSIALLMGLQSMAFFSTITWLPEILVDDGFSEGFAGSLSGRHAARPDRARVRDPGARRAARDAGRPAGGDRRHGAVGLLGVLLVPDARAAVDGLPRHRPGRRARASALILPVLRGRDPGQVAGMTAMAMGVGYLIAAGGPGARRRGARPHRRRGRGRSSCCS